MEIDDLTFAGFRNEQNRSTLGGTVSWTCTDH